MTRMLATLGLLFALAAPTFAQARPGYFSQIQTTSPGSTSVLVGCAAGVATGCTGSINAGTLTLNTTPLATTSGGTGLASWTSGRIVYATGTNVLGSASTFSFDGTLFRSVTGQFTYSSTTLDGLEIVNGSNSATSGARLRLFNDTNASADVFLGSTSFSSGVYAGAVLGLATGNTAGIALGVNAAGPIKFATNGTSEVGRFGTAGGFSVGSGGVNNTAGTVNVDTGFRIGNAATAGTFPRGNGTNFVQSSVTFPDSVSSGNVMIGSATNVWSASTDVTYTTVTGLTASPLPGVGMTISNGALGAANRAGLFTVGRNSSGSGAGGNIDFVDLGGTNRYLWIDGTGVVRVNTSQTVEDGGTTSDRSGTIVGSQSSWYQTKYILQQRTDAEAVLRTVLNTPVYDFVYKSSSYMTPDGSGPQTFTGVVGTDRSDWFLMNVGPGQSPALNTLTTVGYLLLSIQALEAQILDMRSRLR